MTGAYMHGLHGSKIIPFSFGVCLKITAHSISGLGTMTSGLSTEPQACHNQSRCVTALPWNTSVHTLCCTHQKLS